MATKAVIFLFLGPAMLTFKMFELFFLHYCANICFSNLARGSFKVNIVKLPVRKYEFCSAICRDHIHACVKLLGRFLVNAGMPKDTMFLKKLRINVVNNRIHLYIHIYHIINTKG